jgi:hypothetical protein
MKSLSAYWSKLSPRDRRAVGLGAAVLAVLLVLWCVLIPWLGDWADARSTIAASDGNLDAMQRKVTRFLSQRSRLVEKFGPGVVKPPEDAQAASIHFLENVPNLIKASGLQVQSMQPQPPRAVKELPGVQSVPFLIKASGQLPQLARCLESLQKSERPLMVEQVTATGNDKSPGQLEVTLVVSTLARGNGRAGG